MSHLGSGETTSGRIPRTRKLALPGKYPDRPSGDRALGPSWVANWSSIDSIDLLSRSSQFKDHLDFTMGGTFTIEGTRDAQPPFLYFVISKYQAFIDFSGSHPAATAVRKHILNEHFVVLRRRAYGLQQPAIFSFTTIFKTTSKIKQNFLVTSITDCNKHDPWPPCGPPCFLHFLNLVSWNWQSQRYLADFYQQYKNACDFRLLQVAVQMGLFCLNCFFILGDYEMLGLGEDLEVVSTWICFILGLESLKLFHLITVMW